MAAWLKENLTEYYIAGCGREKDLTGEAMIIAYRKERFSECEPGNLLAVTDTVRAGIPLSGTEYVPAYCDGCGI